MQQGFPITLLRLVRCPADEGELRAAAGHDNLVIVDGLVTCAQCGTDYRIHGGILSLITRDALHPESAREMELRDRKNETILAGMPEWSSEFADSTEVNPTLAAAGAQPGMTVMELGCGTGRYTMALAERAQSVVAVDLSRAGLMVLRQKLDTAAPVALVQADVTEPYAAPRAFDRVLSTLHSNLPSRDHRMASLRHVARAIKDTGRAAISMHHYGLRDVVFGIPAAGRYPDSGIFRYHITREEAWREITPFFADLHFEHISASVPGIKSAAVTRAVSRIPLVCSGFGRLFIGICEQPRREPVIDEVPSTARFFGRFLSSSSGQRRE